MQVNFSYFYRGGICCVCVFFILFFFYQSVMSQYCYSWCIIPANWVLYHVSSRIEKQVHTIKCSLRHAGFVSQLTAADEAFLTENVSATLSQFEKVTASTGKYGAMTWLLTARDGEYYSEVDMGDFLESLHEH